MKHIYLNIGIHGIDAYFIKSALSRSIRHSLRSMLVLFRYSLHFTAYLAWWEDPEHAFFSGEHTMKQPEKLQP